MTQTLALGIDVGTSGVWAAALDRSLNMVALANAPMDAAVGACNEPSAWLEALCRALSDLIGLVESNKIGAVCVDGTSGTVLALAGDHRPVPGQDAKIQFILPVWNSRNSTNSHAPNVCVTSFLASFSRPGA